MKTIRIPNGTLTLVESKAICPYCERKINIEEIEEKWMKQNKSEMRMKCKCNRFIWITTDFKGDYIAYDIN